MNPRRIIVVGGLAAGPSAAAKAKRVNPEAEVTILEAGETVSYGICESPYAIAGLIDDEAQLVAYTPTRLRDEKGVEVKTLHMVERLVPSRHRVIARDVRGHAVVEFGYDVLILSTGAIPRQLGVPGEDGRNVFRLRSREDTLGIMKFIRAEKPEQAVIVGGGYIGMEMADALAAAGLEVTVLHHHRLPMAGLEDGTRERVLEELTAKGVHFVTNATVEGMQLDGTGMVRHVLTSRGTFEAGLVLVAIGVQPNVALARGAKIRIGPTGAIAINERQQTSIEGIYAAGDCCEVRNLVTGKPMYQPLATVASRAARVAGENAAGGHAVFKGAVRAIGLKVFGLEVAQVGIGSGEAERHGLRCVRETITAPSIVGIMPGSEKITVVLIHERRTGRLLGANVYGGRGSVLRANILGVAIQHRMTVEDVARFDLIYAPPFAPLWDPILVAAHQAEKGAGEAR